MEADGTSEDRLAAWLAAQISAHDRGELTDDQVSLLDQTLPTWRDPRTRSLYGLPPAGPAAPQARAGEGIPD
ncbi:hypothetical protein GIS00_17785 [Nakamurella sp. YIM 132087]|uniref:Uncharacterized protein n=1 Tax=Nakamurella alba TaxID=2665158 RepID=A0A7K1FQZ7_9ACTN|nr:hypothetical protein [Nakamurella alba]MTD15789.1 hypothetical protein [Nakamurella alba]